MPIKLTKESMRAIFPRAPQAVIDAFVAKQGLLTTAGINASRVRMAYFFANIEHECGGFTIPNLTENINYTAPRMAQVWPNRFKSAAAVQAKYGSGAGWQKKAFDSIYGNRMGNRPGTSDGSTYIGRGGPQWTGRDGYAALERLTGLPTVAIPAVASQLDKQPEVCVAFWTWKNLNRFADAGDFVGCVKAWNGGQNGMADRRAQMAGNDPIIKRLESVNMIAPTITAQAEQKPTISTAAKATTVGAGTVVAGAGAAAAQAGLSAPEILAIITMVSLAIGGVILIVYRITKGRWPWNSTGNQSPELSLLSPQSSGPSLEQVSADLLAVSSAASPATPSRRRSAPKKPRKQSVRQSQKTRTRPKKSSSSKTTAAKKSAPKRKRKSKS